MRCPAIATAVALAGLAALGQRPCAGQTAPALGRVEARVPSVTDSSQTFALFVPPGYSRERRWPALFVLDPRGRGLMGLKLFEDAAARLGWIIMSSYNTLSDGPPEPNVDAMNAMLASAWARWSIDTARLYLAGFSGTARVALKFAVVLRGHVAGVIAVGGGTDFELGGPETVFAGDSTFAYFGATGTRDFNYEEVRALGDRFRTTRVPSRVVTFDGPHSWPPADVCGEALAWLELRAMVAGLRPLDSAWVAARLERELASATKLEQLGHWDDAARLDEGIARDYARWPAARAAATQAAALRSRPGMVRFDAETRKLAERDQRQGADLLKSLEWARAQRDPPPLEALTHKLGVPELEQTAEHADSVEAASARRRLARIFVFLSFYEPRFYLAHGAPERAVRMIEAAVEIAPIQGDGCGLLHQALGAATAEQRARLSGQCPS